MSDNEISVALSVPIGILCSFVVWWVLNFIISPKILFSKNISKIPYGNGFAYRFKFENTGSRDIFDIKLIAKLRIKSLIENLNNNYEVIYLPLDNDYIPLIESTRKRSARIRSVPRIELKYIEEKNLKYFPENISAAIKNGNPDLEEVMKLGSKADLQLFVIGYDSISGAKKIFSSKAYAPEDIKLGYFDKHGLNVESSEKT
jgi:hypothetical protein